VAKLILQSELPAALNLNLGAESAKLPASLNLNLCQELPVSTHLDLAERPCSGTSTGPAEPVLVEGTISANASPSAIFSGQTGIQGTLAASSPLPAANFSGEYDSNVFRGVVKTINTHYQPAADCRATCAVKWQNTNPCRPENHIGWQDCTKIAATVAIPIADLTPLKPALEIAWERATARHNLTSAGFTLCYPLYQSRVSRWQLASARHNRTTDNFMLCWPLALLQCANWQDTQRRDISRTTLFQDATRQNVTNCTGWQDTRQPQLIWPIPVPPPDPDPDPGGDFVGDPNLNLQCLLPEPIWGGVTFNLGAADICQQALPSGWLPPGFIPRRVIIVTHDIWIKLLSDNSLLPSTEISLSIDRDSWGWTWSAKLPERREDLMMEQHEIEIGIDNHRWRGVIESLSGNREHGKRGYTIGGRSLAAMLSSPFTIPRNRIETADRTAIQLAEAELYSTGWVLNWQALDWLVNAGCFSYSGLTPIGAIKQIAESIDAIVQGHQSNQILTVIPRYSVSPWELSGATPDIIIPLGLAKSEGVSWSPRPLMRGVWVSGQSQGVRTRVYRAGSDGAPYHQMIVNALITTTAAGRERGRSTLAATGKRRDVPLTMPLLPDTGVLTPGMTIEVQDTIPWRGYVDAVKITAKRTKVRQTATIEHIVEF